MASYLRGLAVIGIPCLLLAAPALAQDELVENPYYKFWASSKPGATAIHRELTKLSGPEGKVIPDGVDEKRIAYKIVEVDKDHVVVEMVVTEQDFLGYVQAAPTRYIYPAKIKKAQLERIHQTAGSKSGEDMVKVDGNNMKCKTLAGAIKGPNGEQVEFKLWLSEEVPGSIVKKVHTTRQKGELLAETTTTLESFKKAN